MSQAPSSLSKYKALLKLDWLGLYPSSPTLQTLPSCVRKPALFGLVVSDLREAWQSVSTISRLKLELHKHSPNTTKTIWVLKEHMYDVPIFFLRQNDQVLAEAFPDICGHTHESWAALLCSSCVPRAISDIIDRLRNCCDITLMSNGKWSAGPSFSCLSSFHCHIHICPSSIDFHKCLSLSCPLFLLWALREEGHNFSVWS